MDNTMGLVAVILTFAVPLGAMYTYYHIRKLRSQERLAAIARGVEIPLQPELSPGARSRRWGILLISFAIGYIAMFALIAKVAEPDAWTAATFGILPLAVGMGFFIDWQLIRRDLRVSN